MEKYTKTAIILHWLIALFIIAAFALGVTMTNIPGLTPTKLKYFSWHKWIGVTVLGLVAMRLLWRLTHAAPSLPDHIMPSWQIKVAEGVHRLLYVLMFAIPLSGYFFSLAAGVPVVYLGVLPLPVLIGPNPEWKEILEGIHYWLNMLLLAMVILHVAAALKHQFIDRDSLLKRMLP